MRDCTVKIPNYDPFKNDSFDRKIIATNFMKVFEKDENGIILSIDSSWGTGKTTFIRMWETLINNNEDYKNNYETLYFNAWENDYMVDPLLALLVEFENSKEKGMKEGLKNIAEGGKKFVSTFSGVLIKVASAGSVEYSDLNFKRNDIEKLYPEISNSLGFNMIENAVKLKEVREVFRKSIEESTENTEKKIIIFIDELDRCRPSFAIELLENIKHIFSTRGIIFVVSLDKEQLSHSIATIYGQNMDTNGYLRRFFDLDFSLPDPDKMTYIKSKNKSAFEKYRETDYLEVFLEGFMIGYNYSLRDIDKLYYYLDSMMPIVEEFELDNYNIINKVVSSYIYAYLIILKIKEPNLYRKIMNVNYTSDINDYDKEFNLEKISKIDFYTDKTLNTVIVDELQKEGIKKYLYANYISKNAPMALHNLEESDFNLTFYRTENATVESKLELERFGDIYDIRDLFDIKGKSSINYNLEFMNSLNYND